MFVCDYCEEANIEMKRCGDCLAVRYCNQTCQLAHWSVHKQNCKPKSLDVSTISNGSVTSDTVENLSNTAPLDVTINLNKAATSSDTTILKEEVNLDVIKPKENETLDVTLSEKSVTSDVSMSERSISSEVTTPEKNETLDVTKADESVTLDVTKLEESVTLDVTKLEESVTSDVTKLEESVTSDVTKLEESVTSDVTKLEESVTSDVTNPTKATTTPPISTNPNTVVVSPVFDDPANPGFGILNSSSPRQLINFQTGRTYQLDKEAMLERYKGVEEDMTLKIQVPWTEQGLPCTDRELWVYNQSRDFTFCVLPGDTNCGVIRDKILAEGLSCIRPGKKLYFRARLSEEFLLHIQLDSTVDAKW